MKVVEIYMADDRFTARTQPMAEEMSEDEMLGKEYLQETRSIDEALQMARDLLR